MDVPESSKMLLRPVPPVTVGLAKSSARPPVSAALSLTVIVHVTRSPAITFTPDLVESPTHAMVDLLVGVPRSVNFSTRVKSNRPNLAHYHNFPASFVANGIKFVEAEFHFTARQLVAHLLDAVGDNVGST